MDEQTQRDGALGAGEENQTKDGKNPKGEKSQRKGKEGKKTWVTKATNEAALIALFLTSQEIAARVSHHLRVHEVGYLGPGGSVTSDDCFKSPQRSLQSWGSRWSLPPIVFHEGLDFVSCFIPINSWSSAWVQGRAGSGGEAAGIV